MKLLTRLLVLLSLSFIAGAARADSLSVTVAPLPDYADSSGVLTPRVNSLNIDFDPSGVHVVGRPGQTVGWAFNFTWQSNVGDSIVFTTSVLEGAPDSISDTGYVDLLSAVGGNSQGRMLAGTEWRQPAILNPGVDGVGSIVLADNAVPGTVHNANLIVRFTIYEMSGENPIRLQSFAIPIPVSVTVVKGDPLLQTIQFPEITNKSITESPFPVPVEASSGLPITLLSLTPDIGTVVDGIITLHAAGRCELVAKQDGDQSFLPAAAVYQSFEVTKVAASVEIQGDVTQEYTGTDILLSAATTPAGLDVRWLYNGETSRPRAAGIYLVQAIIEDPVHEGRTEAILSVVDNSPAPLAAYADWLLEHFTAQEIQSGLVTARSLDLAEDGSPNLLKYALGLDPWTTMTPEARAALPRFAGTGGTNALVFSLPVAPAGDIIIKVEASSDLVTWEEIARRTRGGPWTGTASVFTGTPDESGLRAQTLVSEPALPVRERRFYRLNIDFSP